MAINVVPAPDGSDDSLRFQPIERLKVYLFGATVLFASFGMGEAVYRLLFSEFDGATDRIPIEAMFGLVFAWLATKFVSDTFRNRKQRSAKLNFIYARNHQIRGALDGITPLAHPVRNQQSIRVIREELDRIEWALNEILPRWNSPALENIVILGEPRQASRFLRHNDRAFGSLPYQLHTRLCLSRIASPSRTNPTEVSFVP
jgi:hypothetical protein